MPKTFTILAGLLLLVGVALATHVPVPLSSVFGGDVLSSIVYYTSDGNLGVPAYVIGGEIGDGGDDGAGFHLDDGDAFTVTTADGSSETVTFSAADFADIGEATQDEVVAVLDGQLTLAEAALDNGHVVLRGLQGGSSAALILTDGPGSPLAALDVGAGLTSGASDIELTISAPAEAGDLSGKPYLLVASTTPGVIPVAGFEVPLLYDATTAQIMRAAQLGVVDGFLGTLDANNDALAVFETDLLAKLYPDGAPPALLFAYVVFDESLSQIEFVSNAFEVQLLP